MDYQPPAVLKKPLVVPSKTLMGPGPSNCSPRVLRALSHPILGHFHPEVFQMMDEVKEGIKYVFQTKNTLTLALSTSGHGGMEAVMCNLLERGDKVLIAVNGIWGKRAAEMARRYGAFVETVEENVGNSFSYAKLETAISRTRPKLLFITQGESSTGVYQELEGLGDICHKYNCMLAVDTVASLGAVNFFADRWGVDAVYTGSQKVLGAPPGLTPITFSPRAENVIVTRKTPVAVYYLDMTQVGDYWDCFGRPRIYHHTLSATLLYGLREALAIVAENKMCKTIALHKECAQRLHNGLVQLGFEFYVNDPSKRLPSVTTIKVPHDLNWRAVVEYCMKTYSLEISGGLGDTVNKVIRIGIMGHNATFENVDLVLKALSEAIVVHARRSKL